MAKTAKQLDTLHVALVNYLITRLESCHVEIDGVMQVVPLPAAELGVMAKLLKDNGIVADKDAVSDLEKLQAELQAELTGGNRDSIMQQALDKLSDDSGHMH